MIYSQSVDRVEKTKVVVSRRQDIGELFGRGERKVQARICLVLIGGMGKPVKMVLRFSFGIICQFSFRFREAYENRIQIPH